MFRLKSLILLPFILALLVFTPAASDAQGRTVFEEDITPTLTEEEIASRSAEASDSAKTEVEEKIEEIREQDVTKPEEEERRQEILALFGNRPADNMTATNFVAYAIQYSVKSGVPANTVILVLLVPLLATLVLFFRHVVGVPSLAMILPIALSITLVATGLAAGLILLGTIILASTASRMLLRKIRIVQLSKVTITMLIVGAAILATLTMSAQLGILTVRQLSIFPVLLLILLSQNIVELQSDRTFVDILKISSITISLGILGYFILASETIRQFVILYPEVILLLIPINILIGRYFGLRITEYFRFAPITQKWQ